MKFLLYIAVIAITTWAGWFFYPDIRRHMDTNIAEREKNAEKKATPVQNQATQDGGMDKSGVSKATALLNGIGTGQPSVSDPGSSSAAIAKVETPPNSTPAHPATEGPADEIEARYPMPTFRTIEVITKDWTSIPYPAFPREVITKVPLTFDVNGSKVVLPEKSNARAVGMSGGLLVVLREGDDTSRIQVPLANTDMKEKLTALYEKYKDYRRNQVIKRREHARTLKNRPNGASEEQRKLAGPKPEVRPGGVIPIMLESLQTLKLTEIKPGSITSWGGLNYEEIDGKVYWTGTVQCTVENALFGPQPTEAMALMKDNKVLKWIYTGSREEVQ